MIISSSYNRMPPFPHVNETIQSSDKSSEALVFPITFKIHLFKLKRQLQLANVIRFTLHDIIICRHGSVLPELPQPFGGPGDHPPPGHAELQSSATARSRHRQTGYARLE